MYKYVPRHIESTILKAHSQFKVVFLGGPRQVGKTTMLKHLAEKTGMHYVSLDNLTERELALSDTNLFLQRHKQPLLIDEIQYAPGLFTAIKEIVDSNNDNGQFWLTGSQQFSIMKGVQESLAGRIVILDLLGLSEREQVLSEVTSSFEISQIKNGLKSGLDVATLYEKIFTGSFPVFSHTNPPDREQFYNSYIQTYIDRDIAALSGIGKVAEFHAFMRACAARTGQVLNIADTARDADVSPVTAKEWLSLLIGTGHVLLLPAYHSNRLKREVKAPKLHFLDTGLAAFLLRFPTAGTLEASLYAGGFFESFVVAQIYKSYLNAGKTAPIYHYRDREKREVDIVIEHADGVELIECKRSTRFKPADDLKHIKYLSQKVVVKNAAVVSLIEISAVTDEYSYIPIGLL